MGPSTRSLVRVTLNIVRDRDRSLPTDLARGAQASRMVPNRDCSPGPCVAVVAAAITRGPRRTVRLGGHCPVDGPPTPSSVHPLNSFMTKKRIAFVGTGGRALSFIEPVATTWRESNELVGLCDLSAARMAYYNGLLAGELGYHAVPAYPAARFDDMIREQKPDTVFVCTTDATHHDYIVRALHAGCDVITEKPMTTDVDKCAAILEAVRVTGRRVRVAFNYRWAPFRTKVKELVASGTIGRIHSVNLEYLLDTNHGADYFRRWHAHADESGTLLVHKSTHHFDLVNWWLDAIPQQVFAYGDLVFYGKQNAITRGDAALTDYERYTNEANAQNDPFRLDLNESAPFRKLYLAAEADSDYLRD